MRAAGSGVVGLLLCLADSAGTIRAQMPVTAGDTACVNAPTLDAIAVCMAPSLHFAPRERYFPILPYFPAFLSNAGNANTPLAPDEIALLAPPKYQRVDWHWLRDTYVRSRSDSMEAWRKLAKTVAENRGLRARLEGNLKLAQDTLNRLGPTDSRLAEEDQRVIAAWPADSAERAEVVDTARGRARSLCEAVPQPSTEGEAPADTTCRTRIRLGKASQDRRAQRAAAAAEQAISRQRGAEAVQSRDSLEVAKAQGRVQQRSRLEARSDSIRAALPDCLRQLTLAERASWLVVLNTELPFYSGVLYRTQSLNEAESARVWRQLRSDFQVWQRLELPKDLDKCAGWSKAKAERAAPGSPCDLVVVEYYFYFVRDVGLTGHPQDVEKVFVFLPRAPTRRNNIRIVVGAAHSVVTPNNVAILTTQNANMGRATHALVEFGGHSMSPDVSPFGQFNPGWDVNWRSSERLWGVRDVQAVTGTGFAGSYSSAYTIPRAGEDTIAVTLHPVKPPAAGATTGLPPYGGYHLLSVVPFHAFFSLLERDSSTDAEVAAGWTALSGALVAAGFPRPRPLSPDPAVLSESVKRLRLWSDEPVWTGDVEDTTESPVGRGKKLATKLPWTASEYQTRPVHILKGWLYRPQKDVICRVDLKHVWNFLPIHFSDVIFPRIAWRLGLGPTNEQSFAIDFSDPRHCLERAARLSLPGTLAAGFAFPSNLHGQVREVYMRFDRSYFQPQSPWWFATLAYRFKTDSLEGDPKRRGHLRLWTGVSLMPIGLFKGATMPAKWFPLGLASVTVSFGPEIDLRYPFRRLPWRFEISGRRAHSLPGHARDSAKEGQ